MEELTYDEIIKIIENIADKVEIKSLQLKDGQYLRQYIKTQGAHEILRYTITKIEIERARKNNDVARVKRLMHDLRK